MDLCDKASPMDVRSCLKAEEQQQKANQDDRYTTNVITIGQKSHVNPTLIFKIRYGNFIQCSSA